VLRKVWASPPSCSRLRSYSAVFLASRLLTLFCVPPTASWRMTLPRMKPLVHALSNNMDRVHSNLIIILLAGILLALSGILFVLMVGREEAISAIGGASGAGAFAVALVIGTLALLFIGYVLRRRRQGHPWFHFILWPAYIGVLAVLGLAALHAFDRACGRPQECVKQIPLYWLPVLLVLLGALVWWVEDFVIRRRKSRPPAASAGPRCGSSEH
jgi:CDP-diglyceride synthetase